jgi:hypothetical protein
MRDFEEAIFRIELVLIAIGIAVIVVILNG